MTATPPQDCYHHQTDTAHKQTGVSSCHFQASSLLNHLAYGVYWRSRGGELLPVRRWSRQSMHWHTERVMMVMFRSWSVAVQIFVRERLEARCGKLEPQTGNRPITLAKMRKHQLVEAAVTKLLWNRDRAERETVGQLRLALRELRQEVEELQPERKKILPPGWKRFRAGNIKELALELNIPICGPNGKPQVKEALIRDLMRWCERQTDTGTVPFGACAADVQVDATIGSAQSRVNSRRRRLDSTEKDIFMTPTGRRHW